MTTKRLFITAFLLTLILLPVSAIAQEYHLLILAPYDFVDELLPLKYWKDETGRPTIIVTLGEIEEKEYRRTKDQPERIKRCIEEYVANHNVQYVLIAGDSDKFPVRYIKAYNTQWGDKYYPSDLYYMDLYDAAGNFDNWDGDGDNIIGEMDFKGGTNLSLVNLDDIDMYPDVAVARVPASTKAEIATYVTKVIDHEHHAPGSWFDNALLVVDGGGGAFGNTTKMNAVATSSLSSFTVTKYYQNNTPYNTMNITQRGTQINNALNNGVGIVHLYGHGNRLLWDGWYTQNRIPALTNNLMLPIVFANACYTGRFHFDRNNYMDKNGFVWSGGGTNFPEPMAIQPSTYDSHNNESLTEHFLVKNTGGAVGYIGCTSVIEHGAWLSTTKGLSPYFFEEYDNGIRVLGELWKNALTTFINDLHHPKTGGMYYYAFLHIHKMMLFGDPSLAVGGLERSRTTTTIIPEFECPIEIIFEIYPVETELLKKIYEMALRNPEENLEILEMYNEWCHFIMEVLEEEEECKERIRMMTEEIAHFIE